MYTHTICYHIPSNEYCATSRMLFNATGASGPRPMRGDVRPVRLLRVLISEDSTQADS